MCTEAGCPRAPQGNVILLTAEDDASDTVVPRLLAAGADLDRVEIVSMVRTNNKDRMFSLITDLELLRHKITQVGNVNLVQIDPISAYLGVGKINSFRTTDVRAVLGPLVELAAELSISVVGIMHFNKKTDVTNALLRISDSLAFGATARHVYAVVDDAENKRKLFVRQAATESRSPGARDSAKKFLSDMLAEGPVAKRDIEEAAEANCIAEKTLRRAKDDLGIIARKDGDNGCWRWRLPPPTKKWSDQL